MRVDKKWFHESAPIKQLLTLDDKALSLMMIGEEGRVDSDKVRAILKAEEANGKIRFSGCNNMASDGGCLGHDPLGIPTFETKQAFSDDLFFMRFHGFPFGSFGPEYCHNINNQRYLILSALQSASVGAFVGDALYSGLFEAGLIHDGHEGDPKALTSDGKLFVKSMVVNDEQPDQSDVYYWRQELKQ